MATAPEVVQIDVLLPDERFNDKIPTNYVKQEYVAENSDDGDDVYSQANPARPGFTKADQKDMWRMGRVQELKVGRIERM